MVFGQKKSGEVVLILDIGTNSVGAAIVSVRQNEIPKILSFKRGSVLLNDNTESSLMSSLNNILSSVEMQDKINRAHIFLSSSWHNSRNKVLKASFEKPTEITKSRVEQLTNETLRNFVREAGSDEDVVEHSITSAKINGYITNQPYHHKARSIEISYFASSVNKKLLAGIKEIITKHFHTSSFGISTFALASFGVISNIFPHKDYFIVNVRGETTDVSLVRNDALENFLYFKEGKNDLLSEIGENLNHSNEAAESMLEMMHQGHATPEILDQIKKYSEQFRKTWIESFLRVTQIMPNDLPKNLLILSDADIQLYFKQILQSQYPEMKIQFLNETASLKYIESIPGVDSFLALESIFVTIM